MNRQHWLIDLTGQTFSRLTVLSRAQRRSKTNRVARWLCRCSCGNTKIVDSAGLRSGQTRSCGCLQRELTKDRFQLQLLNQRFGRLLVVEQAPSRRGNSAWKCRCNCGSIVVVAGNKLTSGWTQSCGCLKTERTSQLRKIDLTGQRIGRWLVISEHPIRKNQNIYWLCRRDDGVEQLRSASMLHIQRDSARRIANNCRRRMVLAMKAAHTKKTAGTWNLVGCTGRQLCEHLAEQFQPGMTLENHGSVWHIDHIIPVSAFDLSDPKQQRQCFHFSNLQPLFCGDNVRKSNGLQLRSR